MKRNKEFIRNCFILCCLLFSIIYFGNFYFSKEKCIEEVTKSMYMDEILSEHETLTESHYTIINHEEKSFYTITIKKYGFLYRYDEIVGDEIHYMNDEHSIDIHGCIYTQGIYDEAIYTIYKNDERVATIERQYPDGNIEICQEWKGNFCTFNEKGDIQPLPYYIYDNNHDLIEIIEY